MVHGWYASAHPNVLTVSVLSRLGWVNELCSLAKHFTLAVPFSTQECKLSEKSELLGVEGGGGGCNAMSGILSERSSNTPCPNGMNHVFQVLTSPYLLILLNGELVCGR